MSKVSATRVAATELTSARHSSTTRSHICTADARAAVGQRPRSSTTGPTRRATETNWMTWAGVGKVSAASTRTVPHAGNPSWSRLGSRSPPANRSPDQRTPGTASIPSRTSMPPATASRSTSTLARSEREASTAACMLAPTPPWPPRTPSTGACDMSPSSMPASKLEGQPTCRSEHRCWG